MSGDDSRFAGLSERDSTSQQSGVDRTEEPDTDERPIERGTDVPPFDFDETSPETMYAPAKTWERLDDAFDLDVRTTLRREHGVRNLQKREFHNAIALLAAENPERIAGLILRERGVETGTNE